MAVTEEILRRPSAREPAARTYPQALPIVPVRARGLTIEGADGRRYLDCLSGAGTLALGHNHPVVLEAIRKVLDSGAPLTVPDLTTPVEEAFVTELLRTLPAGLRDRARVRFCGPAATDAVAAAHTLVRAATGGTEILGFAGSGRVIGADGTEAPDPQEACGTDRPTGLPDLTGRPLLYPQDYRCPFGVGGPHGAELAARRAETALDGGGPDAPSPAGMILEPVQDVGVIPAPDTWMRRMRQITAARPIPLIVDESQTGVGRTGAFWAVEHSGITPDVMILSKAIGGSLPLAVVVHRDDLIDPAEPASVTGLFRGNQLAMAAGAATLAHVRQHRLAERAATLGSRLLGQLRELTVEFPCVGEVRGRGLMIGVELVDPAQDSGRFPHEPGSGTAQGSGAAGLPLPHGPGCGLTRTTTGPYTARPPRPPAPRLATAVQRECLRRGLIVGADGGHPSVVRLLPPLTISDEQADAVLDRLADALTAVARDHCGSHTSHPPRARRHRPDQPDDQAR
ncbi:aminotransferase class III-fold pyridoxal phosphate-dependent enzyme [Streptomyces sp. NPDC052676]|uniref:aminotransferase class III-fold pyridoxal phosphate-dependent enzyme n=1 Tax=Streptomyces sp. NPDC052676 TaxID=3154953 RepID=UPI00343FF55E